jgi:hypothetical protein
VERSGTAELEQPEQIAERNVTESLEAELPNVVRQWSWRAWSEMECSNGGVGTECVERSGVHGVEAARSCSCLSGEFTEFKPEGLGLRSKL